MSTENGIAHSFLPARAGAPTVIPGQRVEAQAGVRARPSTIVLFGLFGCGNHGNDASLEAMIQFLRSARPDAQLLCICDNPELVTRSFDIETHPINWSRKLKGLPRKLDRLLLKMPSKFVDLVQTFRYIRTADVMIIPGTGILDDFGERPYGMPFDIFRWCLAARIVGAKVAFVSIGAGPIRNRLSLRLMKAAARLANYRSYRDAQSKDFMDSVGFDTSRDPVYPDIVFRLQAPESSSPEPDGSGRLRVGVGVMSYYGWYGFAEGGQAIFANYIQKLARFVVHLLDEGHDIRLLTGEVSDQTAVDALLKAVGEARPDFPRTRIVAEPSHSLHDLMRQMAETDVVVATRFHNIVCALKMGKPAISLSYAKKNDVLMAEMGLGAYCQHIENFDVDTLMDQFASLVRFRDRYETQIRDQNQWFQQQLDQQGAFLLDAYL